MSFQPADENYKQKVRDSFDRQAFMGFIGARLETIEPGLCTIHLDYRKELSQQHGFFHAGVVGTLCDNAAGYAAFSLMEKDASILTVEFKLNLLSPASGDAIIAKAEVIKPGRTLTVCRSDVFVVNGANEKLCATAQCTLMQLANRKDY